MKKLMSLKTSFIVFSTIGIISSIILMGCAHEPTAAIPDCKVDSVTYENYIKYKVEDKCLGCHTSGSIQPYLNTYSQVMVIVNDGRLKEVLTGAPGVMQMPYNSEPLPDCMVENIVSWVDNGAPEQ